MEEASKKSVGMVLVLLTAGLVIAGIWTDVVGYSVNLFPQEASATPGPFNRDVYLIGRLFAGCAMMLFARYIPRVKSHVILGVALAMSLGTGMLIISYHQDLIDPALFSSIGVFVVGFGYVLLVSVFYIFFAEKVKTSQVVSCIAVSLVLEMVFSILISLYCSALLQASIVILAPILVMIAFFLAQRFEAKKSLEPLSLPKNPSALAKYILMTLVVIFTIQLVFIRALSNVGIWGRERTNFMGMMELSVVELIFISAIVLLLSYLVFILPRKRLVLQLRCLIGFVVLLAGFQILALVNDLQLGYAFDVVTSAIELFAHLVRWMMVIACIRETEVPAFRVVGIASPFYAIVSLIWVHFFEQSTVVSSTFVMIVLYILLLLVLAILFSERLSKGLVSQEEVEDEHHNELMAFAQSHALSKRESEIFELLMEGKKRSEIETICKLSEGTVKTHITNIYHKLDVHSKGDMIQLFKNGN